MEKTELNAQNAKKEFITSIYKGLLKVLKDNGNEQYSNMFEVDGSSIICNVPSNYFSCYTIPDNLKIEMKFVVKKG